MTDDTAPTPTVKKRKGKKHRVKKKRRHETSSDDDVTSSDEEFTKARVKDHAQMAKQATKRILLGSKVTSCSAKCSLF